ncbi:MAG: ribulose-phosphate 3-epimerase [candidate division Zixibacteria bacterium]|nr:ribulose-phosphate 3-epimerase [candidate division Zixibacteria bacterium]
MKIAPSILSADFSKFGQQIQMAENAGADMIHLDIMDGHFVPNISFGTGISKMSKSVSNLPHDAHLMVTDPENHYDELSSVGIEYISFHIEIDGQRKDLGENRWVYTIDKLENPSRIEHNINKIKKLGKKAGIAINPPTDFAIFEPYLKKIDLLVLMSVNPGFSGQGFIPSVYSKLEKVDKFRRENGLNFEIMVDGGVNKDNTKKLISTGADILVSGSSFFQSSEFQGFIRQLKA